MAEFVIPGVQEVLIFIFILVCVTFFANLLYWFLRRSLDLKLGVGKSKSLSRLIQYILIKFVFFYAFGTVLKLDLGTLAASLGVLSIAIAFSAQQFIQNTIAGIIITTRKIISLEDWIEVGTSGVAQVKDITFTHTVLRTLNSRLVYLSNSSLLSQSLVNFTKSGICAIEIPVSILGTENYERLVKLCKEVAHDHQLILPNASKHEKKITNSKFKLLDLKTLLGVKSTRSFNPIILYKEIAFGRVHILCRFWINDISNRDVIVSEFYEMLFKKMKKAKIKIS